MSPAATLDKLRESWKLYMEECERNNSRDPPSTGEPDMPERMFDYAGITSFSITTKNVVYFFLNCSVKRNRELQNRNKL